MYDVEPAALPDVMAGRPVVLWGKWRGDPRGAKLVLQGHAAGGSHTDVIDAPTPDTRRGGVEALVGAPAHRATRRRRGADGRPVATRADHRARLEVRLLTSYTSFIAVDQLVRTQQAATPVNQPLPLPQGVSALAVGAAGAQQIAAVVPSTPEPRWALALALTLLVVMAALWRRPSLG